MESAGQWKVPGRGEIVRRREAGQGGPTSRSVPPVRNLAPGFASPEGAGHGSGSPSAPPVVIRGRLATLAVVVLTGACSPPPVPEWNEGEGHRWRELRVSRWGGPGFTSMKPSRTGVDFANVLDEELALENEHRLVGSGVALGDVDGDGLTDIYLNRLQGPNALYRNLGGWRFEEVTARAGVAADDRFSTGAAFADVDGDGDLDLIVTSLGGPDVVFRNDGSGRFSEDPDAGLAPGMGSTTVALADVDGDGDLDLYLTTYKSESASDVLGMLERSPRILEGTGDSVRIAPEFLGHYRLEERGGRQVAVEQAEPDRLYLNDGTGRFEPVSWTGGAFLDEEGRPLDRDLDDFGLAARFYDVDGDGDPDLYVCNDFADPDQLWINQGDGTFRRPSPYALRTTSHASMSVDFADVDRDGEVDFFVAEMRAQEPSRQLLEVPFHPPLRKPIGVMADRPQIQRNTLFLNRGDGTFAEIAELAGVDASDWSWASMFVDVDLDGFEDLLVANGYSRDTQHGDVVERIEALQGQAGSRELKRLYPRLRSRNAAFRNHGDLTFGAAAEEWGFGEEEDISHGMAAGDLDGDGDLDVVINRLGAPARVLRNDAVGGRVAVRLRGAGANTASTGARVRLLGGAVPVQEREVTTGGLYLSSSEPLIVFATGEAESMTLEVEWPRGGRTVIEDVESNRLYEIAEVPGVGGSAAGRSSAEGGALPEPLFVDRSDLLDHRHPEREFEDFRGQPLLPYQASRLGPGVSWIDVDRDGDPDLVVPPGAGGRLTYLRNDGDSFTEVALEDAPSSFDRTSVVTLPGRDGALALAVGQSSYEAATPEEARSTPAALLVDLQGGEPAPLVSGGIGSTGPLAVADVDGDGDLDLFVGGRIVRGLYPLPPPSLLLRNEGGTLRPDPRAGALLEEMGMVSGAVFSDVDADGDPDLLLALDWGPIRLLLNEDGRFIDATEAWGLGGLRGRWNGITTGDLDGDGRMDVVVTGWGRNIRHRPRPGRPLILLHDDLDRNGMWDPIPVQAGPDGGTPRPLVGYMRMRLALPSIRSRVPTFEAYGGASLETILGRPPEDVYETAAFEYDHLLLLNRGDRFEAVSLPMGAQLAPAMGVAVGDLDGDGREDVFLSQNFFPTHLFMPRLDGGLGLLLLGDGRGGLEPVPAHRSGIRIHGDQRGVALADYDGDGRVDLAVAQNGARTRLLRNAGARPGLRVRLEGPAGNPHGVGVVLRVIHADGSMGPAREVHGGAGYWSMDDVVQVLGLASEPAALLVRWSGGRNTRVEVPAGVREVTVRGSR